MGKTGCGKEENETESCGGRDGWEWSETQSWGGGGLVMNREGERRKRWVRDGEVWEEKIVGLSLVMEMATKRGGQGGGGRDCVRGERWWGNRGGRERWRGDAGGEDGSFGPTSGKVRMG